MSESKTLEASYRKSIGSLDMRRKALESESQVLYLELTTPPEENIPPMGIDSPLVDADGYPRGDIDIYRARTLRQRFQIIQTDHKELMKQTEHLLIKLAALKVRKVPTYIADDDVDYHPIPLAATLAGIESNRSCFSQTVCSYLHLESTKRSRRKGRILEANGSQTKTKV
jgi:hypothetical protein